MSPLTAVAESFEIVVPMKETEADLTAALHRVSGEIMRLAGNLRGNAYGDDHARASRDEQSIKRQRVMADALIERLLALPAARG